MWKNNEKHIGEALNKNTRKRNKQKLKAKRFFVKKEGEMSKIFQTLTTKNKKTYHDEIWTYQSR
jgi:hypothetical protein